MKVLLFIFIIFFSLNLFSDVQIGSLKWRSGGGQQRNKPYLEKINTLKIEPKHNLISHSIRSNHSEDPKRHVTFGFNDEGGGYLWSANLKNFKPLPSIYEIGQNGYGKGMLGAIRDRYHYNKYNPEQAGRNDYQGVKVVLEEDKTRKRLLVNQYIAPLYVDGSASDKPPQQHFDLPKRSGFDFSSVSFDDSEKFGVPSLTHEEYWMFSRFPYGIDKLETNDFNIIEDISHVLPGIQKPKKSDFSFMVYTLRGLRPDVNFRHAHYRSNGEWQHVDLNTLAKKWSCYYINHKDKYKRSKNKRYISEKSECTLDLPLLIVSTSKNLSEGVAQALWIDKNHPFNKNNVKTIDQAAGKVSLEEDRTISLFFEIGPILKSANGLGKNYRFLAARSYLSGLLSPKSAEETHKKKGVREAVTSQSTILIGTPLQIFNAVNLRADLLSETQ